MKIYSIDRIVEKYLQYIENQVGDNPVDWLYEVAEQNKEDVYQDFPEYTYEEKWELIDDRTDSLARDYVRFIVDNYPERVKNGALFFI